MPTRDELLARSKAAQPPRKTFDTYHFNVEKQVDEAVSVGKTSCAFEVTMKSQHFADIFAAELHDRWPGVTITSTYIPSNLSGYHVSYRLAWHELLGA